MKQIVLASLKLVVVRTLFIVDAVACIQLFGMSSGRDWEIGQFVPSGLLQSGKVQLCDWCLLLLFWVMGGSV